MNIKTIINTILSLSIAACNSAIIKTNMKEDSKSRDLSQESIKNQIEISLQEENIPHELLCPLTLEIMEDPVVAADGHSYERKAIKEWLSKNDMSPNTNLPLINKDLKTNYAMKNAIEAFLDYREKTKNFSQMLNSKLAEKESHLLKKEEEEFLSSNKKFIIYQSMNDKQKELLSAQEKNIENIWNKKTDLERYNILKSFKLETYLFLAIEFKQKLSESTQMQRHSLAQNGRHMSTEEYWNANEFLHLEWIKNL